MCDLSRREFLAGGAAFLSTVQEEELLAETTAGTPAGNRLEINKVDQVAPDVYFHEGDLKGSGHCNNGWIIFEDYVLVIDANFPSGAKEILPKIRALTERPIRFALDTHHHGDHAYGNQIWVENGAVPVAHTGVVEEMRRYETGLYGSKPGRWEEAAKGRADVRESKLKPPSLLFPRELIFDDGKHRVELHHLGVAHTHGDTFAWLPKERILFAGDACVNGPYNFVGDGDVQKWIQTLEAARKLGARVICPGHGLRGDAGVLDDQQAYFKTLRDSVGKIMAGKAPREARGLVPQVRATVASNARIARFVGDFFPAQAEKVYTELTGKKISTGSDRREHARLLHARAHGHMV